MFLHFRAAGLRLKPKKCGFLRETVKFLGHVISRAGILPDPAKTEKVRNYPGCYRSVPFSWVGRLLHPVFATIATLHALTKKNATSDALLFWP